jgi:hypothetical protein
MYSAKERRFEVNKQDLLLQINNQCSAVQTVIAKNCHNPDDTELLDALSELRALLDYFLHEES